MYNTVGRIKESGFPKDWMVGTNDVIALQIRVGRDGQTFGLVGHTDGFYYLTKWPEQEHMDRVLK